MKIFRLASLFCICATFSFGASKEVVELQRDVAILQDQVRQVQRTLDEKLGQLTLLMQQTQDNTAKANTSLQTAVSDSVAQQVQPVLRLGSKVDGVSEDVHGLRDTINDLNSRLSKLDAKVTDLGNRMSIMQNPPAAPGAPGPGGMAGVSGPPAGMSAESTWASAEKDRLSGNFDLALKEYQDYITYFPSTDYASAAQYQIGQIYYNRSDYDNALKAFDTALERFPENPKTPAAHLMKGQTLVRTGDRSAAMKEFRFVIDTYPRTEDAKRAAEALRGLGATVSTKPSPTRRRK